MKIDVNVLSDDLRKFPELVQTAEEMGFDGLWTAETQHDPFLPLALAAEHSRRIELGTGIAVAFARSPTVLAHTAWDLASLSGGRFILGLGTQVKPHVERRFGMTWDSPAARLREMIEAIRAVWRTWQTGQKLNFRGQFFRLTLMTPFFSPPPLPNADIPIYTAGVNEHLIRLAGELCQGFHVHPLHTAKYIREFVIPNIEEGAAKTGRSRADVALTTSAFVISGRNPAEIDRARAEVRQQVAFYASTPSYRTILELHGWTAIGERLSEKAAYGRWADMPGEISDEMLAEFAVEGTPEEVPGRLIAKYSGLIDRLSLYIPFQPGKNDELWQAVLLAGHRS